MEVVEKDFRSYAYFPNIEDVCKLLILKEDDKIIGRSLIWKLSSIKSSGKPVEGVEYFMDRQYTIKDSDVQKFRNYAKEQGWCYKSYNNHHSLGSVTIDGEEKNVRMTIEISAKDYNRYPYMDTFKRYDINKYSNILQDINNEIKKINKLKEYALVLIFLLVFGFWTATAEQRRTPNRHPRIQTLLQ